MDLISVIMPAYNAGAFISEAIESVLGQSYTNIELIIVDDGSEDNTLEILESYGDRIHLYKQPNEGAGSARNLGARMASGKWLAFLDSDDTWAPEKLQRQLENRDSQVWSHTDWYIIGDDQDGTVSGSSRSSQYGGLIIDELIVSNFIGTSTVLLMRDAFFDAGGFDTSLRALQDWDLWIKIADRYELDYVSEPLVQYRIHGDSTSRNPRNTKKYHLELIDRIYGPNGVGEGKQHLRRQSLASSYGVLSHIAEESGDFTFALDCAIRSAAFSPFELYKWKCVARTALGIPRMLIR